MEILIKFKRTGKNSLPASQIYVGSEFILYHKVNEAALQNVRIIWT